MARRRPAPGLTDEPYAGFIHAAPGPDGVTPIIMDPTNKGRKHGDIAATMPHLFVLGGTGAGKALALSTLIPTPAGFTRMGQIRVGDTVFGRDGNTCTVTDVWDIIQRPELYRLWFSTGDDLRADAGHQWTVVDPRCDDGTEIVVTTADMAARPDTRWVINPPVLPGASSPTIGPIHIIDIEYIEPGHPDYEPARCIAVDADDAVFLVGSGFVPTHNSRRVLAPNIIRWGPRPVIALSSKDDLIDVTAAKRARRGPTYILDLAGTVRESAYKGVPVTKVRIDPCAFIETDNDALKMADLLLAIGGGAEGDGKTWADQARRPLAVILRAGGYYDDDDGVSKVWGGGVAWALDAAENPGPDTDEGEGEQDLSEPNWNSAFTRAQIQGSRHARSLQALKAKDPKLRDSVGVSIANALTAWSDDDVAGAGLPVFVPDMLDEPGATLYIVSPMSGNAGAAVSTLLVRVVEHWRHDIEAVESGERPPVLFVLDEFANGSKLPAKFANAWVGEGRGLGCRTIISLQDSVQLEALWGVADAKVLRAIMPATLILPGAVEDEMLERAAKNTPSEERVTASVDASGRASQSGDRTQLDASALIPQRDGEARLLLRGRAGVRVLLPDISKTDLLD